MHIQRRRGITRQFIVTVDGQPVVKTTRRSYALARAYQLGGIVFQEVPA